MFFLPFFLIDSDIFIVLPCGSDIYGCQKVTPNDLLS